jgi:small subunit ribosomal protein S1
MADLLDAYDTDGRPAVEVGDRIRAKIVSIGREHVFVDTGTKLDGVIERAELSGEDGSLPYEVGDTIEAFVVSKRGGEIRLSKAVSGIGGLTVLREAREKGMPVEGKVLEVLKGGYRVEVLKHRAFCPFSQMDLSRVEDPSAHVGKTYSFLITELADDGDDIVLSRRALLEKEREEARASFFETIREGDIMTGTVKRIMPYGALVEIAQNIEGMVHVSEMSWSRILSPEDILHPGEKVTVKVLAVEADEGSSRRRISLSMKQVSEDPWASVEARFRPQEKLRGHVTRIADYGAFVEIAPGIEGLVHISEMSYTKRVKRPSDLVRVGDEVDVMIKEISPDQRRISLSMKDAEGDPWIGAHDRYPVGRVVEGVLERKERFGLFVRIEPGITGLLPKSVIDRFPDAQALDRLREGDPVTVTIERLDVEQRRVSLAPADSCDGGDWKTFAPEGPSGPLGTLGDKLRKALDRKNKD